MKGAVVRKNAPAPRGNAQNDASEAKIANKIMAQGRIGLTGIGVGANDGGMRGGVVRKKAPAAVASDAKPKQNLGRALNLNYGGSLMNGALVGQSKVTAEMQHAVESVGESGHSLDQYEPLKKLGAGTSGVVHLVKRKTDGSLWVSKEVRLGSKFLNGKGGAPSSERQAMASRAEREAVMHEVKLMSSIQCEHIIEFKAAFADELKVTIIMEYAAGGSVADLVHERRRLNARFDEEDVWRCVVQVASGLQAMHARDIIHRDIKPANVLVSALGAFKIADLGIAVETGSSVQGRLRTGKCGTLICMAPEVCKDKPFDARADIWSLGCLVYEMCWLRPAFPVGSGRIEADLRTVISLQDQARRVEVPACFSGELRDVLASCLQLQQTDRPYARALLQQPFVTAKATELGITIPEGGEKLERRESGGGSSPGSTQILRHHSISRDSTRCLGHRSVSEASLKCGIDPATETGGCRAQKSEESSGECRQTWGKRASFPESRARERRGGGEGGQGSRGTWESREGRKEGGGFGVKRGLGVTVK